MYPHVFSVTGDGLDDPNAGSGSERWEIHRPPPSFDSLEPKAQMFETGVKDDIIDGSVRRRLNQLRENFR